MGLKLSMSRKMRRKLSGALAVLMAVTLAIPTGMTFSLKTANAAGNTTESQDGDAFYDFRDGSVIPTDTDGKSDITYGKLTVKVGTKNAYGYNGAQHGINFKDGNSLEIAVDGPTKISLGGCRYSASNAVTATSADGTYVEEKEGKASNCYDQDGSTVDFTYTGEAATTITIAFSGTMYVPCVEVKSLRKFYDFRDGSIIPTDTNGKSDVTYGSLTVKVGTKNAYGYNGAQHGINFKDGNSFEIAVDGPTKISLGGCRYSAANTVTATSADGTYVEEKEGKASNCYDQDGSTVDFTYKSDAATTITIAFSGTMYVPCLIVAPLTEDVPDDNGAIADSVQVYNFADGSVVPSTVDSANPLNGSITSKDNMLTVNGAGDLYMHDTQHGLALYNGNTFEVKVAGDATVTFNLCQYGSDSDAKIIASTKKGEFTTDTSQPLLKGEADGLSSVSFKYEGVATTLKFTISAASEMYLHGINVSNEPAKTETPELVGNGKADVWDFGAEKFDESAYNNMLTEDIINSWYSSDVQAGSEGITIGSFSTDELFFNPGGKTNNRIRTSNTNITRYDKRDDITIDGTTLTGYLYANTSTPVIYTGIKLYKNDILTLYTGSNGGASTIICESPSGIKQTAESNGSGVKIQFAAPEYGVYKIYSANEKLVIYRAVREHTQPVTVSGSVDTSKAAGIESVDYGIVFTNKSTGEKTVVKPQSGSYSAYLNEMYDYAVSLDNANGYVIKSANTLNIAKGAGNQTFDIEIEAVDLVTVSGKIVGLSDEDLSKLKLSFVNNDYIYVPEFKISGDSIVINAEKGVTYDIIADGVNDYYLSDIQKLTASADITQDITFAAKPTYKVNVTLENLPDNAAPSIIFTNINEDGYEYTFTDLSDIKLRDGQYSVTVRNIGNVAYKQKITSNVKVDGKDVDKKITFEAASKWDFSALNGNPGIETIGENNYYSGLKLNGSVMENKTYLLTLADGEIEVPVKKGQIVTIGYCYCASFTINGGEPVTSNSGSTTTIETTQYTAQEDGVVVLKGVSSDIEGKTVTQTYFTSITVSDAVEYVPQLYVGKDKEFKTINDALDRARAMARTDDERVEIVVDPGNYEEMIVVDTKNISIVNAAGSDSSLEILNQGVDIGENVVRITSYYGHGYDYYSMGSDCKYDAELLEANKENGYLTKKNPGSGTTDGSYWNATAVVTASGFKADGIVFENSFNQYISEKEANDIVVEWATGGKGTRPVTAGDVSVQNRSFVERAAALAVLGDDAVFTGCKFIGRQDTLYGQTNISVMFNQCDILGAVDYIFGGMTAVFYKCNLVMNTSEVDSDIAYITAAQQGGGRGYLMYECTVTSTTPGVDTASQYRSKPGYFGRPWAANTSEVVFYNTAVETTDFPGYEGKSLIVPAGWNNTLGGESPKMYEYGTIELSGEDNSASRAAWAKVLTEAAIDNGATAIKLSAFINSLADYTNVNDAIKKAGTLNKADYKDFSEVEKAVNAVKADYSIDSQADVEQMAQAILAAINNLEKVSAGDADEPVKDDTPADVTDNNSSITGDTSTKTGDTAPVMALIITLIASFSAMAAVIIRKNKKSA